MPTEMSEMTNCITELCMKMFTTLAMIRPKRPMIRNEPMADRSRFVV